MSARPEHSERTVGANGLLSIGAVATATGISTDTLRAWERRYGRPRAVRLSSRHRRYSESQVRWLRRVSEALALGHRPSKVVTLDDAGLDGLLKGHGPGAPAGADVEGLLDLVRSFREDDLRRSLRSSLAELEPLAFVGGLIGPLVTTVGRLWVEGELEIRHEHFLTEVLEDLLRSARLEQTDADGRIVALATLVGEPHGLGLLMAAFIAATTGARAHVLGTEVENPEIARAALESGARGVAVSVSLLSGGAPTDRAIADLRRMLRPEVRLIVGGQGVLGRRRVERGVDRAANFEQFVDWLDRL